MNRALLSEILHEFSNNVYFQPSTNTSLTYPCIVYSLTNLNVKHADNSNYMMKREYEVVYISKKPDPVGPDGETGMIESIMSRFGKEIRYVRRIVNENLYNDVFNLYF